MKRTQYVNIGGKDYPMRFSLGASMEISKKFGSMKKMAELMTSEGDNTEYKSQESIIWILALLIKQGCSFKNIFEKDIPPEPGMNLPIVDGKYVALEMEELSVGIDLMDIAEITRKIFATIHNGETREVKDKEKSEEKTKNVEATQETP